MKRSAARLPKPRSTLGKDKHPPVPNAGIGQLQRRRAGVEAGEVRQHGRAHETGPGPSERPHGSKRFNRAGASSNLEQM